MFTALAAFVAAVTLGSATPHSPAMSTAGPFLLEEIQLKVDGRWDAAWRMLYPLHRLVAPRATFVRCESRDPFVAPVQSMRVIRVGRMPVHVPGLTHTVAGVGVTLRATFPGGGWRDPFVITHTFHLVPVRGHWTWLLSPERFRLYRSEGCSDMPAA